MMVSARCRRSAFPFFSSVPAILISLFAALPGGSLHAQAPADYVPGELIVKARPGGSNAAFTSLRARLSARRVDRFAGIGAELWSLDEGTVAEAIGRFAGDPAVEYMEPNYRIHEAATAPNDALFGEMWALENTGQEGGEPGADISILPAWDSGRGDGVLIAVIDGGVDWYHPDLKKNLWINPGEIPGNGIDDDGNWFVDDVRGWDFVDDDNDPLEDRGHATHIIGTIAATGNNGIGVAGVSWDADVLPIRFLDDHGSGTTDDALRALDYAMRMGARMTSNSWGNVYESQALRDAIEATEERGMLFIAAAGNRRSDIDHFNFYPAGYDLDNIISVAATNRHDRISIFSNFGAVRVDLAAPGTDILSTVPGGGYGLKSGTSMSVPHVAGVAALLWSADPGLDCRTVKQYVMESVDPLPSLQGMCVTGGRLNAEAARLMLDSIPPAPVADLAATGAASSRVTLEWSATGDDGHSGRAARYDIRYSTEPITEANFDDAAEILSPPVPALPGTAESVTVNWLDFATTYHFGIKVFDDRENGSPLSNVPAAATLGIPAVAVDPDSIRAELIPGGASADTLRVTNLGEGTLDAFWIDPPSWLSLDPESLSVPAGATSVVAARFDATDLPAGPHESLFFLGCNDPISPVRNLRASLDVHGGPDIDAVEEGIDFGDRFLGTETVLSVAVRNRGTATLHVTGVSTDHGDFAARLSPGEIPAGSSGILAVTFAPSSEGPAAGTLTVTSDDPDEGIFALTLSGGGVLPPVLSVSPPVLADTVHAGNTGHRVVRISNEGAGPLRAGLRAVAEDTLSFAGAGPFEWLSPGDDSLEIEPGGHADVDLSFDGTALPPGEYHAGLSITSNDPLRPVFVVQAGLFLVGAPHVALAKEAIDFGEVPAGALRYDTTAVENRGSDTLHAGGLAAEGGPFFPFPLPGGIPPGGEAMLVVRFAPETVSAYSGTLTASTDDPQTPLLAIPVAGRGVTAAAASIAPASVAADLASNERAEVDLTVENPGGRALNWELRLSRNPALVLDGEAGSALPEPALSDLAGVVIGYDRTRNQEYETEWSLMIDDLRNRGATVTLNFSFPINEALLDGFDVFWITDTYVTYTGAETKAIAAWIRRGGALLLAGDNPAVSSPTVQVFNSLLNAAGAGIEYLEFESDEASTGLVVPHPTTARIDSIFLLRNHARLSRVEPPAARLVVDAGGFPNTACSRSGAGRIVATADELFDNEHILGADNRRFGNQVFDWLAAGPWLSAEPLSGVVEPGAAATVRASFDAASLPGGSYEGYLHLVSDDPSQPVLTVSAELAVTATPDIAASPPAIEFGDALVGFEMAAALTLKNRGADTLHVTSYAPSSPEFSVPDAPGPIAPGASRELSVRFHPAAPGTTGGTLTVRSDDPDEDPFTVPLSGVARIAPSIGIEPESIRVALLQPGEATREMTIRNDGGSDLAFTIGIEQLSDPSGPLDEPLLLAATPDDGGLPVVISDGADDTLAVDVRDVRGECSAELALEIDIRAPFDPADLGGIVSLDVDGDPLTGAPPRFGNGAQTVGAEYSILCFPVEFGYVTLENAVTGAWAGQYPVEVRAGGITLRIPLDALGGDEGAINVAGVFGTDAEPLDYFPDAGHGSVLPLAGMRASLSGATVPPGGALPVQLTFASKNLPPGARDYRLTVRSNDPLRSDAFLYATLRVAGHATADWVYPPALDLAVEPGETGHTIVALWNRREVPLHFRAEAAPWRLLPAGGAPDKRSAAAGWADLAEAAERSAPRQKNSAPLPRIEIDGRSGTLAAGGADTLRVAVQSEGVAAGLYSSGIVITYEDDPLQATAVPLALALAVGSAEGGSTALPLDGRAIPKAIAPSAAPNPFNPSTTLRYGVPRSGRVVIRIHDVAGRTVRTVLDGPQEAGYHAATWDGRTGGGVDAASGVYFYTIEVPGEAETRKLVLLR